MRLSLPQGARLRSRRGVAQVEQAKAGTAAALLEGLRAHGLTGQEDLPQLTLPMRQSSWVYASVRLIESAIRQARIRFRGQSRNGVLGNPVADEHPLQKLWDQPTRLISGTTMLSLVADWLLLSGEVLIAGATSDNRTVEPGQRPERLVPLRGGRDRMKLLRNKQGDPTLWDYDYGDRRLSIHIDSAAFVYLVDPDMPYRGLAPLEPAMNPAEANMLADEANRRLLRRGGENRGYITIPDLLDNDVVDRLREEIAETWDGEATGDTTRLLHGGAEWKPTTGRQTERMYGTLTDATRKATASIFGVYESLLGGAAENYATFHGQRRAFYETTVFGLLDLVEDAVNSWLRHCGVAEWAGLEAYADRGRMRRYVEDVAGQAGAAKSLRDLGVPAAAAFERAGLENVPQFPGDDVSLVPMGLQRLEDVVEGLPPEGGDGGPAPGEEGAPPDGPEADPDGEQPAQGDDGGETPAEGDDEPEKPAGAEPDTEASAASPSTRQAAGIAVTVKDGEPETIREQGRRAAFAERKRRRAPWDDDLASDVRSVWSRMRGEQMEALERFAAEAPDSPMARAQRSARLPAGPGDPEVVRALASPGTAEARIWRGCCGEEVHREVVEVSALDLLARKRRQTSARLLAEHLVAKGVLSAGELEQLLVVANRRWAQALAAKAVPTLRSIYERAAKAERASLGVSTLLAVDPRKLIWLDARGVALAGDATTTTSRRVARQILRVLADQGTTTEDVRQAVRRLLPELQAATDEAFRKADRRALTIARTEVAAVDGRAVYDDHAQLFNEGVVFEHEWMAASKSSPPNGRTRPTHVEADGQRRVVGSPFTVGGYSMSHPGDMTSAPPEEYINCRCAIRALPRND